MVAGGPLPGDCYAGAWGHGFPAQNPDKGGLEDGMGAGVGVRERGQPGTGIGGIGRLWEGDGGGTDIGPGRFPPLFPGNVFLFKRALDEGTAIFIRARTHAPGEEAQEGCRNNYGMLPSAAVRQDMANPPDLAGLETFRRPRLPQCQ